MCWPQTACTQKLNLGPNYKHENIQVCNVPLCNTCGLTDSNRAPLRPMLPLGVRPRPPTRPAHISDKMSPYRFGMTSTSYCVGSCTMFRHTVSKYFSSNFTSGCFSAASRQQCRNRPSDILLKITSINDGQHSLLSS